MYIHTYAYKYIHIMLHGGIYKTTPAVAADLSMPASSRWKAVSAGPTAWHLVVALLPHRLLISYTNELQLILWIPGAY